MTRIDLKDFERKIRLRRLQKADYPAVVELQLACFPKMKPWSREQFGSQLSRFPEGQLALEYQGRLVASAASLILDFDLYSDWHDWAKLSDKGMINNHDPKGDTLYGIEIMVHPEFRGMRLARRLYDARKQLCRDRNLMRMVIGGRIPGYKRYAKRLSPEEYVERVRRKQLVDPVLTTQLSNGFELLRLISDYLPSDEDSSGVATHMEWTNLAYAADEKRHLAPVQRVRVAAVQYPMRHVDTFDDFVSESIQQLVHEMGVRLLDRFPALSQISFRGENHTYDPVPGAENADPLSKTYTSPFPAWGLITLVLDR